MKLSRRKKLFPGDVAPPSITVSTKTLRAFHAPQREHVKQEMPPRKS